MLACALLKETVIQRFAWQNPCSGKSVKISQFMNIRGGKGRLRGAPNEKKT
jgi:hypothetical protein